jgi:hypothetical protein
MAKDERTHPMVPRTMTRRRKNCRSYSSISDRGLIVVVLSAVVVLFLRILRAWEFGVRAEAVGSRVETGEEVVVVRGFKWTTKLMMDWRYSPYLTKDSTDLDFLIHILLAVL